MDLVVTMEAGTREHQREQCAEMWRASDHLFGMNLICAAAIILKSTSLFFLLPLHGIACKENLNV
jgi:hypothetical protein